MREKFFWDYISNEIFTIASVDSFDVLKSQAAVYCGDQYRTYRVTAIQITQPLPNITLATPLTLDPHETTTAPLHQHPASASNRQQWFMRSQMRNLNSSKVLQHTEAQVHTRGNLLKENLQHHQQILPNKPGKSGPKGRRTVAVKSLSDVLSMPKLKSHNVASNTETTPGDTCTANERQLNENTNPISTTPMDTAEPQCNVPGDLQRELCNSESIVPTSTPATTCTLKGFQEQPEEKQEMTNLWSKALAYNYGNQTSVKKGNDTLKG